MHHIPRRDAVYITMNFVRACNTVDGLDLVDQVFGAEIKADVEIRLIRAGVDLQVHVNPFDVVEHLHPTNRVGYIEALLADEYATIEEIDRDYFRE